MRIDNLDDGTKLEAAWHKSLSASLVYFRALLSSSSSSAWKQVSVLPLTASTIARDSGKSVARGHSLGQIDAADVVVHRRNGKTGEVYRAVVEVDCGSDVNIDTFRGCLATPETRPMWDRMVEEATTLDVLDAHTRVSRINYRLGWPSSPRDAVTISKTFVDEHTLVDITTSLPRSKHEPVYLRPAPPHVRAHVTLLAWCIQLPSSTSSPDEPPEGKARITCFWSWNPKGAWAVGGGVPQHLPSLVVGLVNYVRDGSEKVPVLLGYGPDVAIGSVGYDTSRVTLSVSYAIVSEGGKNEETENLRRQVEFGLSSTQSWDVQISVKAQHGRESSSTVWSSFVGQAPTMTTGVDAPKRLILRFSHSKLEPDEELVRVSVSIERTSSATAGVRINGIPVTVESIDQHPPQRPLLAETASMTGISLRTISTVASIPSQEESTRIRKTESTRSAGRQKSIASLIRRNYIYFTSLLQEPEQKWRPVLDSRGVAIQQLNSIDKTLVVFRAEAVFVGVGLWDLFAVLASPGSRLVWDKTHEDSILLKDVNELTDLWQFKSKAAWPIATTYKSPSSVHLFGFSTDDTDLFPRIPAVIDPTVIRTQIDLQGWSIESLSPNTTQVTLLEQSDPRGWSNKSSIPQVMMSTLAGVGEFAIKHGAPPVATRLGGARALVSRYDVEKETFRFEYESAEARRSNSSSTSTAFPLPVAVKNADISESQSETSSLKSLGGNRPLSNIECEIRCDADQWANNFTIVIDPPHQAISALRRHRLSPSGGGLWLTIEHDPLILESDKVIITVRRGSPAPGSKTVVTVNGSKIKIDLEDLPETEVQLLKKQKRGKPSRAPLDQPPALGTIRKKQSTMDLGQGIPTTFESMKNLTPSSTIARVAMPLSRWYSVAAETTRAAIIPMTPASSMPETGSTPVDAAVRALGQVARIHADRDGESTDPNSWQPVSDRDGLKIERRMVPHVSETFPVFRAGRIIEGFTAEEVSTAVQVRKNDERFDKPIVLQSFGQGITTSHLVAHTSFPFRPRSMLLATVIARMPEGPPPSPSAHVHHSALSTIFHASSSSFDASTAGLDPTKYNPLGLTTGNIVLEGWILETIDPYSHEQYAIPSTRCMYVAAIDYSGNIPLSVNNMLNASLPRSLVGVENLLKTNGSPCRCRSPVMMVLAPDKNTVGPWALEGISNDHTGVDQRIDENEFSLVVTLQPVSSSSVNRERENTLSPRLRHVDSRSTVQSGRSTSTVIDLAEDIRKGRKDLLVASVEISSKMIKSGCMVDLKGISLPAAQYDSASINQEETLLPLRLDGNSASNLELPFKITIISLEPSVLQAASLDPTSLRKHLLRITLPTAGYDAPIIDPLSDKSTVAPSPRPRWLLDLLNDGAVVQLSLKSKTSTTTVSSEGTVSSYTYRGIELPVEEERNVKLSNSEVKEVNKNIPQLVNRNTQGSTSLAKPVAVAKEYLKVKDKSNLDIYNGQTGDGKGEGTEQSSRQGDISNASGGGGEGTVSDVKLESANPLSNPSTTDQPTATTRSRYSYPYGYTYTYNLWKYSRLPRFSSSAPVTAKTSPITTTHPTLLDEHTTTANTVLGDQVEVEMKEKESDNKKSGMATTVTTVFKPVFSIPMTIVICLVCLLLGSLLRSLLSETDYIIYNLPEEQQGHGYEHEQWKELKRLAQIKIGRQVDLVLAIATRGRG